MHRDVKRLIDWATAHGWTDLGVSGSGHYRLRHTSGTTLTVPATPSDPRSMPNVWATLARLTGQRPPKQRAGRYRHTGQRRPSFDMDAAVREQRRRRRGEEQRQAAEDLRRERERQRAQRIDALQARHVHAVAELRAIGRRVAHLAAGSPERKRALRLIAQCLDIEDECERLGAPVVVPVKNI